MASMAGVLGHQGESGSADRPLWELVTDHWKKLTPRERDRLRTLLLKSHGRPNRLTQREQAEVKRMVTKLEAGQLATELLHRAKRGGLFDRLPRGRS
jgi:hypothetical protein